MITDGKKALSCHKKLSALVRGITSNHDGDFYYLNCLHSFKTECRLRKDEIVCRHYYYYYTEVSNKSDNILKCKHGEKSMKVPFIIYVYMKKLLEETT